MKRPLILLIIFLLGATAARSQDTLKQYVDFLGSVVQDNSQGEAYYYQERFVKNGHTFVYYYYMLTGTLAKVKVYLGEDIKTPDGWHYSFYDNKQLEIKIPYADGKINGMVEGYDEFGKRTDSALVMSGIPIGHIYRKSFFGEGISQTGDFDTLGKGTGVEKYYLNGKLILIGYYSQGYLKDSLWTSYYDNGKIAAEVVYDNDQVVKRTAYDESGQVVGHDFDIGVQPQFNGNLNAFLNSTMRYPAEARENGVQGRVRVQFIVKEDGSVLVTRVVSNTQNVLNLEGIRVVKAMPKWQPAKFFNRPVPYKLTQQLRYILH